VFQVERQTDDAPASSLSTISNASGSASIAASFAAFRSFPSCISLSICSQQASQPASQPTQAQGSERLRVDLAGDRLDNLIERARASTNTETQEARGCGKFANKPCSVAGSAASALPSRHSHRHSAPVSDARCSVPVLPPARTAGTAFGAHTHARSYKTVANMTCHWGSVSVSLQ
jgi:hypothetical protein